MTLHSPRYLLRELFTLLTDKKYVIFRNLFYKKLFRVSFSYLEGRKFTSIIREFITKNIERFEKLVGATGNV